jgi:hypothetical protein
MDFQSKLFLDAIGEFRILHGCIGKLFVEWKPAEQFRLHGQVAGVKVTPVRLRSGKKKRIRELDIGFVKPRHERSDFLTGGTPAGKT